MERYVSLFVSHTQFCFQHLSIQLQQAQGARLQSFLELKRPFQIWTSTKPLSTVVSLLRNSGTQSTTVMNCFNCSVFFYKFSAMSSHKLFVHVCLGHKQQISKRPSVKKLLTENVGVTFTKSVLSEYQQLSQLWRHHIEHKNDTLQQWRV